MTSDFHSDDTHQHQEIPGLRTVAQETEPPSHIGISITFYNPIPLLSVFPSDHPLHKLLVALGEG